MNARRRTLLANIERAFAGVELGDGVSLRESRVIDTYGTAAERREARAADEKRDWRKLVDDPDLTVYLGGSELTFLDAAGVRFHLPACLYRVVRDFGDDDVTELWDGIYLLLTQPYGINRDRLAVLTDAQRACVREVLVYLAVVQRRDDAELGRAVHGFWSQPAGSHTADRGERPA